MISIEKRIRAMICRLSYEERKRIKWIIASVFITGIFSYFLLMVYGYTCPDGIIEGLYYYTNADWALANGRWAIRYLNYFIGHNVVIPFIVVILYCLLVALSMIFITEIFRINKIVHLILASSIMIASPCVITILPFTYMALSYALAFLGSVLYCYLGKKGGIYNIGAIIFLLITMGSYQSYIGSAVLLIILIFLYELLSGYSIRLLLKQLVNYCFTGITACILDIAIYKSEIYLRKTYEADRLELFGIRTIISSLSTSIRKAYRSFFEYFMDGMLQRQYFYAVILLCAIIILMSLSIGLCRKKQYMKAGMIAITFLLIPIAANFIVILVPYGSFYILMCYHYILIIPFIFALLELLNIDIIKTIMECLMSISVFALISTYVLSANASFMCWKISYRIIEKQTDQILADVFDLKDYQLNRTRILIAGFPSDSIVRSNLKIYDYAIGLTNNVAYWEDWNGLSNSRRMYLLNYYGIEGGYFSREEYAAVIESQEFEDMPVWPQEGSVKMFYDMAVVKLSATPPSSES